VDSQDGLVAGLVGTLDVVVMPEMTAIALGSGDVLVLATPSVLALAERAAVAAVADRLPDGSTTVGVAAELTHSAPTPVGAVVTVTARLDSVEDRRLRFTIVLADPAGEVATVAHTRIVVDRDRFVSTARGRLGSDADAHGLRLTGTDHANLLMPPGSEPAARAFYGDVLGLPEVPKPEPLASRGGCWFQGNGIDLHLSADVRFVPADKAHVGLLVADLDAAAAVLAASGAPVTTDDSVVGVHRLYTNDPFGNRIELIQSGEGFRERRFGQVP
jgi:predicted thioesterase/catechol 2,3-dioxygenase-like lactoylglutathione lyase family enzyme